MIKPFTLFVCFLQIIFSLFLSANEKNELIDSVFKRYERPFTVLSLENNALKWGFDYPQSYFIEMTPSCDALDLPSNGIWLKREVIADDIYTLSTCEAIDVLLAGDLLYQFPSAWRFLLSALQDMAHLIICDLPTAGDSQMHDALKLLSNGLYAEYENSVFYIIENESPFLMKRSTLLHPEKPEKCFEVICDYHLKKFKKTYFELNEEGLIVQVTDEIVTPWVGGINLLTYIVFNGQHPTRGEIMQKQPWDQDHTDWMPHNMILQGKEIVLIDQNDPTIAPIIKLKHNCAIQMPKLKRLLQSTIHKTPSEILDIFTDIYGHKGNFRIDTQ